MKKSKVMAIVPYEGLKEVVNSVQEEYPNIEVTIIQGDLEQGVEKAKEAEEMGYDAIISRGGTTEQIMKHVSIPVINIEVSGFDYMRTIRMAKNISGLKAFIGFSYITEPAKSVNNLLETDIELFTIQSLDEIYVLLNRLKDKGYELIIGDVATCRVARDINMNAMLLTSGKESVESAFKNTMNIIYGFNKYRAEIDMLQNLLENSKYASAIFDKSKNIIYKNSKFDKINLDNLYSSSYILEFNENINTSTLVKGDNNLMSVLIESFYYGDEQYYGVYIESFEKGLSDIYEGIKIFNYKVQNKNIEELLKQKSIYSEEIINATKALFSSELPLIIIGEPGVGKKELAKAIHSCSSNWNTPFIVIDCQEANPADVLNRFFEYDDKIISDTGATICFDGIENLKIENQHSLANSIEGLQNQNIRLIAIATKSYIQLVKEKKIDFKLYNIFSKFKIHIPGMKEGKLDINKVVNLFIIEANIKFGKQITGIEDDAIQCILEYPLHNNFEDLKNIIEQLVLMVDKPYITSVDVKAVMKMREPEYLSDNIEIIGTLDEIEDYIIRTVLKQEDGNQSSAAKKLGISRSTLWRKIKSFEGDQN